MVHELPKPLEQEFSEARETKQIRFRQDFGIRLLGLAQYGGTQSLFGDELNPHLISLSQFDAEDGVLSTEQKEDVRAISAIVNDKVRQLTHFEIILIKPEELEGVLVSGNPSTFMTSVTGRVQEMVSAMPPYLNRVWERGRWRRGNVLTSLSEPELEFVQQLGYSEELEDGVQTGGDSVTGIIGTALAVYEAIDKIADWINELGDLFCGPDQEEHTDPWQGIRFRRTSYLRVPWRGVEWGDNNQEFTARYISVPEGQNVSNLERIKVIFEIRLEGSGFDRLDYPLEVKVSDRFSHTVNAIRQTRYNQKHEVIIEGHGWADISVVGKVHYGGDGFMTGAGLVPRVIAYINGEYKVFGTDDSVWKYGVSI